MFEQAFKNIDDFLWKEAGASSDLDHNGQSSWMLFLKYLDDLEAERANQIQSQSQCYVIEAPRRWSKWAAPERAGCSLDHETSLAGDDLFTYVKDKLSPCLRDFKQWASSPDTIEYKIGGFFVEIKSKFQSGFACAQEKDGIA